jgi:uncharacterized protein with HEPN domain
VSADSQRPWAFYLDDMIGFAERVLEYTNGCDGATFASGKITYDATLRNLELLGEAATHVPPEVRERFPLVPWRLLVATRNRLIHAYLGIDDDTIWSIVTDDVPRLLETLREIRKTIQ